MAAAKLIVMYPMPKDMAAFERAYSAEHIPMAAPIFQAAGATKAVLTKMIDAQSIMVACAACYDDPHERAHALGPIFRKVFWYSIAGAAVIGVIALLQAYVFPGMIPIPPVGK